MKNLFCSVFTLCMIQPQFAQFSGNVNYQNPIKYVDNNIKINNPDNNSILLSVKGLANVKADEYVAIFSMTQQGETADEVNLLINKRINTSLAELSAQKNIETHIDMVSFVPIYQYITEKKIFSKKTYNEIPKGFELKKNLHIRFSQASQLNEIISALSKNEIYDMVRVDYFVKNMESIKKDLLNKAKTLLQEKTKNYEIMMGENFTNVSKSIADGYKTMLPTEMYKSYEAYNSSSLNFSRNSNVNEADKSTTLYYQPILDKEFDFVINPTVLEPVIQVMYEVKLMINKDKKPNDKTYILVTPNGELKNLNLN